jgi:hypothetical protein
MNPSRIVPNTVSAALVVAFALVFLPGQVVHAQEVARTEYIRQLPKGLVKPVPTTPANVAVGLWGDPASAAYRDVAPRDGIDDARGEVLLALGVKFAPILVQNTVQAPVDPYVYIENREVFPLTLDLWRAGTLEPEFDGSLEANLSALDGTECPFDNPSDGFSTQGGGITGEAGLATTDPATEDCKLKFMVDRFANLEFAGQGAASDFYQTDDDRAAVLFINTPGSGPDTWSVAHLPEYERTPDARKPTFSRIVYHPFVREVDDGYELVLQYWFYYPSNDSGMNHEGDWEHLNVIVSPMDRVTGGIDLPTLQAILQGDIPPEGRAGNPLVIKRIDYYLHEWVSPFDFSVPNAYAPRSEWEAEVDALDRTRFGEVDRWEEIRYLAWEDDAETIPNTHPFGYIGSDNKGLNQAMEMPGGSNRDSHGTFPLPGRYNNTGPGGTTDEIDTHVDHREWLADWRAGEEDLRPDFERGGVVGFADPARLRMMPDFEQLEAIVTEDAAARAEWAWLVLPIRWGYPATKSPFAGILENYNTGNNAPIGPIYNSAWNVSGPTSSFRSSKYRLYDPHSIPSILPTEVQDNFRNDLGFLNLTVPVFLNLPPLDFVSRIAAWPFREILGTPERVYIPNDSLPTRFVGLATGVSYQTFDEGWDYLTIAGGQYEEFLVTLAIYLAVLDPNQEASVTGSTSLDLTATSLFLQVPFYLGERFVSENLIRNAKGQLGFDLQFDQIPDYSYRADVNLWEYAGALRVNVLTSDFKPFVKGGYGWSWYRLENIRFNDNPFATPAIDWIGPDGLWPNTWHYGLGVEWLLAEDLGGGIGGLDVGVRAEWSRYHQNLGVGLDDLPLEELAILFPTLADIPGEERVHRNDFLFGLTISF